KHRPPNQEPEAHDTSAWSSTWAPLLGSPPLKMLLLIVTLLMVLLRASRRGGKAGYECVE
ncbi:unnamed protein product, partial [Closterium sp. Yama58-4]